MGFFENRKKKKLIKYVENNIGAEEIRNKIIKKIENGTINDTSKIDSEIASEKEKFYRREMDKQILSMPKEPYDEFIASYHAAIQHEDFDSAFLFLKMAKKYYPYKESELIGYKDLLGYYYRRQDL